MADYAALIRPTRCADVLPHDPALYRNPGSHGGLSSCAPPGQSALHAQGDLLNQIRLMLPVQSPSAKIFSFPSDPNHLHIPRHPGPHKGAFRDRHERKAREPLDASGATDESAPLRTAKSCGPDAPTLASSS